MDADDLLVNPDLLAILYNYYLKYNLDIIEFKVIKYDYKNKRLFIQDKKDHKHFQKEIIYQPELSEILFYEPGTKKYTGIICKSIWNKIIRKELAKKIFNYIGEDYYRDFVLTSDDTLILILALQFASNFSNINYSGYMYNIREKSITHGKKEDTFKKIFDYNYFLNFFLYSIIFF